MTGSNNSKQHKLSLSEDWISVIIAFVLIIICALGILGKNGIPIKF